METTAARKNQVLLELWHRSRAGDKAAFCQLTESQRPILLNYAGNFTRDRELAKDLVQDLFLGIWESRHSLDLQVITIYLLRALRNRLLDHLRTESRFTDVGEEEGIPDDFLIENHLILTEDQSDTRTRLREAIARLPRRQQEVLFLRFYQGMDNDRIAEVMEINRQSVANHLYKALQALKAVFVRYAFLLLPLLGTFLPLLTIRHFALLNYFI